MNLTNYEGNLSLVLRPQYFTHDSAGYRVLGWNIPMEAMDMVHPHWRAYPAPASYYHIMFFIIYLCLMITSAFGNGMVIWIFSTSKSLRTPSNLFVVNLALFDITMMLEMPLLLVNTWLERPWLDALGCDIYAALGAVAGYGAGITNAAIAFDRYKTISSPMDGRLNFFQAGLLVFLTWMWTVPFTALPYFRIWGSFSAEGFLTTCTIDYLTDDDETRAFMITIFIWVYCFPMVLICTFYTKLIFHVRAHEKMLEAQAKKMNVKSLSSNPAAASAELRIAKIAFTIWFLYFCAWTPYGLVALTGSFGDRSLITPMISMFPALAAKTVSCIDPWIYAMNHPKYRKELEKRIPWLGIVEKAETVSEERSVNSEVTDANKC